MKDDKRKRQSATAGRAANDSRRRGSRRARGATPRSDAANGAAAAAAPPGAAAPRGGGSPPPPGPAHAASRPHTRAGKKAARAARERGSENAKRRRDSGNAPQEDAGRRAPVATRLADAPYEPSKLPGGRSAAASEWTAEDTARNGDCGYEALARALQPPGALTGARVAFRIAVTGVGLRWFAGTGRRCPSCGAASAGRSPPPA
jgi:hypothetical protein